MKAFDLDFPRALGAPEARAGFRTECEDFVVLEDLGFAPDQQGEHWLVQIQKRDDNTPWVAKQLARLCGVKPSDVGYCGLKDRRAVTRQWFSVYQPRGNEPHWQKLNADTITWLQSARHGRKLRRGDHRANAFVILLRDCADWREDLERRLQQISERGVPNYFGEQRFGRDAGNLQEVDQVLATRGRKNQHQGMVLSAARSWLFNQVLAARVLDGSWQAMAASGEPASGPLWGRGRSPVDEVTQAFENALLEPWSNWCNGLEHAGLTQERRMLVMQPQALQWHWQDQHLCLQFSLAPGQFATSLLRELALLVTAEDAV